MNVSKLMCLACNQTVLTCLLFNHFVFVEYGFRNNLKEEKILIISLLTRDRIKNNVLALR